MYRGLIYSGIRCVQIDWDNWGVFIDKLKFKYRLGKPRIYNYVRDDTGMASEIKPIANIEDEHDKDNIDICTEVLDGDMGMVKFEYTIPNTNDIISVCVQHTNMYYVTVRYITNDRTEVWKIMDDIYAKLHD